MEASILKDEADNPKFQFLRDGHEWHEEYLKALERNTKYVEGVIYPPPELRGTFHGRRREERFLEETAVYMSISLRVLSAGADHPFACSRGGQDGSSGG